MISGDYGTVGLLIRDSGVVKAQLDTLTAQAASGHVADTYATLGAATQTSLDLRPQINHLQAKQDAIDAATGRLDVTQTALARISAILSTFSNSLIGLNGVTPGQVDSTAAAAKSALQEVAGLLDTKDGDTYVFGGTNSSVPPVPDPEGITTSPFYGQIGAAVIGLAANGAAATAASTLATASSDAPGTTPFAAAPGQPAKLNLGDGTVFQTGLLANANTFIASAGPSTTGSYARDILRGLATLSNLSSSQVGAAGFSGLVGDLRTSFSGAATALGVETGALGSVQSQLADIKTQASDAAAALSAQVGAAEDVDPAKTLVQLSQVQTQLTASYKLIAEVKGLSLANYL